MPKSSSPTCAVLRPSDSEMVGIRAAMLAADIPHAAKITKTALRHARTSRGTLMDFPAAWDVVWGTEFLGRVGTRIDSIDSIRLSYQAMTAEASEGRERPNLAAVAALAGVSPSTASLAFSGAGPVADATRARVLAAAETLNYGGPDPRAQSLRRGRSGIVGVVMEERVRDA